MKFTCIYLHKTRRNKIQNDSETSLANGPPQYQKYSQTLNYTILSYNLKIHELSQNEQINHISHMCMNAS